MRQAMSTVESLITPSSNSACDTHNAPADCSTAQLQHIMQLAQLATALLDSDSDQILWCTADWLKAYPSLGVGASWLNALSNSDELAKLYEAFKQQGHSSASVHCDGMNSVKQMSLHRQDDGGVVLLLRNPEPIANDMHLYMQARESMFTTSRTISVSEMATTLAHEIKQPISTISNILKGVRLRLNGREEKDEAVETALEKRWNRLNSPIALSTEFVTLPKHADHSSTNLIWRKCCVSRCR